MEVNIFWPTLDEYFLFFNNEILRNNIIMERIGKRIILDMLRWSSCENFLAPNVLNVCPTVDVLQFIL